MVSRLCARCGREIDPSLVVKARGLCPECYVEVFGLAEAASNLSVKFCRECYSYYYKGSWHHAIADPDQALRDLVLSYVEQSLKASEALDRVWVDGVDLEPGSLRPGEHAARVLVKGLIGGSILAEERVISVKVSLGFCPTCLMRRSKSGHEAVIQIRGVQGRLGERELRDLSKLLLGLKSRYKGAIVSVEERKEGIDLIVGDLQAARSISNKIREEWGAKVIESYKVKGFRRDGSRKVVGTFSIRLPQIEPLDLIYTGGSTYIVLSRVRGGFLVIDVKSGSEAHLRAQDLWSKGFRKAGGELTRRVIPITISPSKVSFLDVNSGYETVEFLRDNVRVLTEDFNVGEEYEALISGDMIYILGRGE